MRQRNDIRPEETLTLPFIVGVPDFINGILFHF